MRIGLVIYGSLDTLSGGYLYDRIVVEGLRRLGHEVEVIGLPSGSYLRRLAYGFSSDLLGRLLAGQFDILIQDELCHPTLFSVNQRLRRQGGPLLVALVHHTLSDEPRHPWHNKLLALAERRFLASVDGFIHNSATTSDTVASLVAHNRPQVIAYPAGDRFGSPLTAEFINERADRPGPLQLLFLGNVIARKGLVPLLQGLAKIDRPIWRLSVVGALDFDPAYTAEARQLVRDLDLSESVHFLGPLDNDRLVETLSESHLFCMPYAYEGFGIAILEAMAFGLPAIGCLSGAAGETIRHGENGYLLALGDLAGLEPLLRQLHQDRDRLRRLALAAHATYGASPGWQDGVAAIDGFLRQLKGQECQTKTNDRGGGFDPHYLAAKKSIDDRALNHHVWETLRETLPQTTGGAAANILEIGSGIGTMLERMVDRHLLTGPVTYMATDCDPNQRMAARRYLTQWAEKKGHSLTWADEKYGRLSTPRAEISLSLEQASAEELADRADSPGTFHLIIAHAVLDLVDFPNLLPRLLSQLTDNGMAYCTCNFDGETVFLPKWAGDKEIIGRYHASMEARLAGASHTGRRLLSFLQGPGLELLAAGSSDWVIYPRKHGYLTDETSFLHAIIETVERELCRQNLPPADLAGLIDWARLRHQQVDAGELSFLARHLDLLARRRSPQP